MKKRKLAKFSVEIENRVEALVLVDAMIALEVSLRAKPYLTGNIRLADTIRVARQGVQRWWGC
jgi:hypothetical protein